MITIGQHRLTSTDTNRLQPTPTTEAPKRKWVEGVIPDRPRTGITKNVNATGKPLSARNLSASSVITKSLVETALGHKEKSLRGAVTNLLFSISPKLVPTANLSGRAAIEVAEKFHQACREGADRHTKMELLQELKGHLESASAGLPEHGNGLLVKGLINFVDKEIKPLANHHEAGKLASEFDHSQLKHVETREKKFSAEDVQLASNLERLGHVNGGAAIRLSVAIEIEPRLAPFAAAAVKNPALVGSAEKLATLSKLNPAQHEQLLAKALDQLGKTNTLDAALLKEVNQALAAGAIRQSGRVGFTYQGGLQNPGSVWNTKTAESVAKLLVDASGTIDRELITELRAQLKSDPGRLNRGPHLDHLERMLTRLENSESLRTGIEAIEAPKNQDSAIADMLRATLGLPVDHVVTEVDARRATLAALLADMRQNDVGSCFATANGIMVHNHQPERFVADIAKMIENGHLTRPKGAGTVDVPVSDRMSTKELSQQIELDANGHMVKCGGNPSGGAIDLRGLPAFNAALHALGIPDSQMRARLTTAAQKTGSPTTPEALLRQIVQEETGVSSEMLSARTELQKLSGEIRTLNADLSKLDNELSALKNQGAADSLIQAKKQEISTLEKTINEKIELYDSKRNEAIGRTEAGSKSKAEALAKFDRKLAAASDAFLGQQNNRLLRSWEYTLSAFAEQGLATQNKAVRIQCLFGSRDVGPRKLQGLDAKLQELFPGNEPEAQKLRADFKTKLETLLNERLQMRYDASRAVGGISPDGRSDRGAFVVYDSTGSTNPLEWTRADSQEAYARMLSGLILETGLEIRSSSPVENKEFSAAIDALANYAVGPEMAEFSTRGITATFSRDVIPDTPLTDYTEIKMTPWSHRGGAQAANVQANYFERGGATLASLSVTPNPPGNGKALLKWIVGNLEAMRPQIMTGVDADPGAYSIPIGNAPHVFLLTPGHPDLRSAWNPGTNLDTWLNARLDVPGSQVSNRALADDQFGAIRQKLNGNMIGWGKAWPEMLTNVDNCRKELEAEGKAASPRNLHAKLEEKLANDPEKAEKLKFLDEAMANTLNPPSITFADSNWGAGGVHTHFAIVINPGTGQPEMWSKPTTGDLTSLNQQDWLGCHWNMATDPRDFGEA